MSSERGGGGAERYFESVAAEWETLRRGFFSDDLAARALAAAGVAAGQRALDVGAGSGFLSAALLERGLSVVAVDPVAAMLEALERRLGARPGLDVRLGSAERLPLDDASVDFVFANMVLHHLEDPLVGLREMTRVLRPGGRLVVTDMEAHAYEFLRREQHDRWLGFERARVLGWLRAAGLEGAKVESAGETCCATSCDGEAARIGVFLATGARPAPRD